MLFEQNQDVMLRSVNSALMDLGYISANLSLISMAVLQHDYKPTDAEYNLLESIRDMINNVGAKVSYLNYNVTKNALKKK